jgi:c-di-GMP-binding flagellar brake protein YcgR
MDNSATMVKERRASKRIAGMFEVHCLEPDTTKSTLVVTDLSEDGCYLNAITPPVTQPDSKCRLSLRLGQVEFELEAVVVYGAAHEGVGLKFVNMSPETREKLIRAIEPYRL